MPHDKIGMDPAELRRRNFIQPDAFPLTTNTGAAYDSGEYEKALDAALAASGYAELRAEQARRRAANDPIALGIGVSTYVEVTAPVGLHVEFGATEIHDDGTASVFAGTSVHGQGHHTSFAMLACEVLGIPMDQIKLVNSDTDRRASWVGNVGISLAADRRLGNLPGLQRGARIGASGSPRICSRRPQKTSSPRAARCMSPEPRRSRSPGPSSLLRREMPRKLPEGLDPEVLRHELDFDGTNSTFPFGAHVSVVEVDTQTGKVEMLRHVAVDDCGRILNPLLVSGQQHGGIAQGAAQALYEWVRYDEDGNPVTATLLDYSVPSAAELPSYETSNTQTDSPRNPLGAKGIGESGTIGSTPAIHNAVVDAAVAPRRRSHRHAVHTRASVGRTQRRVRSVD